jgi:hypothetical protein
LRIKLITRTDQLLGVRWKKVLNMEMTREKSWPLARYCRLAALLVGLVLARIVDVGSSEERDASHAYDEAAELKDHR